MKGRDVVCRYFAFGSNMSEAHLAKRAVATRVGWGKLKDFRLAFTRFSKQHQCGAADALASPGDAVYGVVFEMTMDELTRLDVHEGRPYGSYDRDEVDVEVSTGTTVRAWRYYVVKPDLSGKLLPSKAYLQLLVDGAEEAGLPSDYVQRLKSIKCGD